MSGKRQTQTIGKDDVGPELIDDTFPADRPLPAKLDPFADAELGFEDLDPNEQLTPFLIMLQGLSPQLNEGKAQYVPGAKLGDIVDTGTQEVYSGKEGVDIIVCAKWYGYKMWVPRDLDGGFRGDLAKNHPLVVETLKRMEGRYGSSARFNMPRYDGKTRMWSDQPAIHPETGEEVELQETGQFYVIYGAPGHLTSRDRIRRAIVNFKSTSLKPYVEHISRHMGWTWPTRDGAKAGPAWYYKYRLTTIDVKNAKGEFKIWQTHLAPPHTNYRDAVYLDSDPELYLMGHEFYDLFTKGEVKADQAAAQDVDPEAMPL